MDWFVKAFLKASTVWLALGVTLGVAMAVQPVWTVYRPVHLHLLLLGFVTMMIFGVGYHVFPRFTGVSIRAPRAATAHWWLANLGLASMALGFAARAHGLPVATLLLAAGGMASAVGAYIFVWLVWSLMTSTPRAFSSSARGAATDRSASETPRPTGRRPLTVVQESSRS